jgi:hypothetical protein
MKSCSYCGKQYSDDLIECPTDGNPLSNSSETSKLTNEARKPKAPCPACGAADDYTTALKLRSSFSVRWYLVGGLLGVFVRNAGQPTRVRCNKCGEFFHIRTSLSKVSAVLFWFLVAPTIVTLIVSIIVFIGHIVSHG